MAIGPRGGMITAEMRINEVVAKYPQTIRVFFRYGMQCIGCYICSFHSIAEGAKQYGVKLESLLSDLNAVVAQQEDP